MTRWDPTRDEHRHLDADDEPTSPGLAPQRPQEAPEAGAGVPATLAEQRAQARREVGLEWLRAIRAQLDEARDGTRSRHDARQSEG